jgi:hypothetical protein
VPEVRVVYGQGTVPDEVVVTGRLQLAKGGVFGFYEFVEPPGPRRTDEEWRAMLREGRAPPQPTWTATFTAP